MYGALFSYCCVLCILLRNFYICISLSQTLNYDLRLALVKGEC